MGRKVNVSEVIGKSKLNGFMYGVIAIGVIMILFDGYDMGVWAGTLTSLRTDTGIEDVTLGFITSAGQFGSMLGGIFFGMLSDRIGRKTSLLLATGIYSVFTGLIGIASSPEALTVFKLVSGLRPCWLHACCHDVPLGIHAYQEPCACHDNGDIL